MLKVLLVLVVLAVVAVLALRARRTSAAVYDSASVREVRATQAATDQAVIARQGGQGASQGGTGGG